ncbi:uncharacterized protein [Lolium perenne]|uniref:uncharacterized protein n=1 Tax=Lolium perenne TaxID=4522 RepID=UPI0021F5B348|nr:uncharacterized protein LOC127348245 [Lolium perenne]
MDVEGDVLDAKIAAYWARREKEKEDEPEESHTDNNAYEACLYRGTWNRKLAGERGSYEDATSIPAMRFTDHRSTFASTQPTLQIFSVKVEEIMGGLLWPIDVYGMVAVRDVVDHKRNIIFNRQRDNSQTLTEEDSYLALTGPTRAVVVNVHPVYFEVNLKVKGATMSEDKDLSLLAACYTSNSPSRSCVIHRVWTSKLSTLKLTFGHILYSVEATIKVEVIDGRWPCGYQGVFTAKTSSINRMEVPLLAFEDGELPMADGCMVKLSRRVVSVELVRPKENLRNPKLIAELGNKLTIYA